MKIDPYSAEEEKIAEISAVLKKNGVIVFPTDTFYGIGVNGLSPKAIRRVYRLKKRDPSKPLLVLISDMEMLENIVASIPDVFWHLSREFWPGPLTIVFKASSLLPPELSGSGGTIGVRLPALPWLRSLVARAGFPITATSANISGEKELDSPSEVISLFLGKVDLIVDGGKTQGGKPSTVIDLSSEKLRILRDGAIPEERLNKFLSSLGAD